MYKVQNPRIEIKILHCPNYGCYWKIEMSPGPVQRRALIISFNRLKPDYKRQFQNIHIHLVCKGTFFHKDLCCSKA